MKAEIGRRLKKMRIERGLTQKDLASSISGGIDYTYIGKIERGEQLPSLKVLLKISEALSVPPVLFFQDEAAVVAADPFVQRLLKRGKGRELLAALQTLPEEDLSLVVEIVRVLARHRDSSGVSVPVLLAAEDGTPYGEK